jgi:hypothetical protein
MPAGLENAGAQGEGQSAGPFVTALRRRSPELARIRIFFVLVALVFTCVYPFFSWVNNPNENVRTYMTMALVEDHTFRIDTMVERYGWVNDMATVPEPDGSRHLFSVKGPGVSYAGVPFYWAMTKLAPHAGYKVPDASSPLPVRQAWFQATTFVLRLFTIQIPCFLFLIWLERWLRETSPDPVLRLTAVAAAGLGTNYLAYSLMFASHAPFAIAAFSSFAITTSERARHPLDPRQRRLARAFLAGFFAGLATLLEYHALPVSVCLTVYALFTFWRPSLLAMFSLGGVLNVIALAFFQWRAFKNPLTPGHRMSENPLFAHNLSQGLFGIEKPDFGVFKGITFNLSYGFLGTSPFMWLGLLALPYVVLAGTGTAREQSQRRGATIAWMLTMLVLWTTVSAANNWRGGWTIGPRYLGAAPPFFAYGAVCALESIAGRSPLRRAVVRGVAGGAALASVLSIGIVGMHFNTVPEEVVRPFSEFTWPLVMAGFVPHHALELFGVTSPVFWYVVAGCAVGAAVLGALGPWQEQRGTWALRLATFGVVFVVAMKPALSTPTESETRDFGANMRHWFATVWQPPGRDRISTLREEAERYGNRRPCLWLRIAELEKMISALPESARDQARAGDASPAQCGELIDRFDHLAAPPAPTANESSGPSGHAIVQH